MGNLLLQPSAPDRFPVTDLAATLADGFALPLQNARLFESVHAAAHRTSQLFRIGHAAVELSASTVLEDPSRVQAVLLGCGAFEAISFGVYPRTYEDEAELAVVYAAAKRLTGPAYMANFASEAEDASGCLRSNTPVLGGAISEVAARSLGHSEDALTYALAGAGMMRELQICIDKVIAAA